MSDQPTMPRAAMRGAVDLSNLGRTPPAAAPAGSGTGSGGGIRVDATEAGFQDVVLASRDVAALVVLWSAAHPETEVAVTNAVSVAAEQDGRLRVVAVEVQANPGVASAFGAQQIPMTLGLIAGQPVPLFAGVQPAEQLRPVVAEILNVAAQNGVTGRIDVGAPVAEAEPELDPNHEAAFDAIEAGDLDGAVAAYDRALKANPADEFAKVGLAQVNLMKRVSGADLQQARAAAAANPTDVAAQCLAADLDLAGGHVEDAFVRLIDLVRATSEEDRDRARAHLLELFEIIGPRDERVVKARRSLMSALF